MSRYKNFALFAILVSLVAVAFLFFIKDDTIRKIPYKDVDFSISIAANPDSIILVKKGQYNTLVLHDDELLFNNSIRIKPELQEAFFLILKRLEVKRPISKNMQDRVSSAIAAEGVQVKIYENGKLLISYELWGDKEQKTTYIKHVDSEKIYIVNIPGYSTYIADIFYFNENNWKNNSMFESSWRSLKELHFQYPEADSNNFSIEYAGEFFKIPQLEAFDTLVLLGFLEQFSNLRINRFLSKKDSNLDSILKESPDLIVKIDDLESSKSNHLLFYEIDSKKNDSSVFVIGKDKQVGIISRQKFDLIAKNSAYFSIKEK